MMLAAIAEKGLTVEWILDTHPHADHLSAAQYFFLWEGNSMRSTIRGGLAAILLATASPTFAAPVDDATAAVTTVLDKFNGGDIGSFFAARDIWGWHWGFAAIFAAPGLLLVIPGAIGSIFSLIRRR